METVRFDELELQPQILRGIKAMGFEEATPIQSKAIPVVMSGADVIGQAQTGTGKTAAFGIPILQKVDPSNKKTQVIILSPENWRFRWQMKSVHWQNICMESRCCRYTADRTSPSKSVL